jgi:PhnB protein
LIIGHGAMDVSFYTDAFSAKELQRWSNNDETIPVAELEIEGNLFHLHEDKKRTHNLSPVSVNGTAREIWLTHLAIIGLFKKY